MCHVLSHNPRDNSFCTVPWGLCITTTYASFCLTMDRAQFGASHLCKVCRQATLAGLAQPPSVSDPSVCPASSHIHVYMVGNYNLPSNVWRANERKMEKEKKREKAK